MPLYTYDCKACGEFAAWAGMADSDRPQACPACAGEAPRAIARPRIGKAGDIRSDGGGWGEVAAGKAAGGGCGCGGGG